MKLLIISDIDDLHWRLETGQADPSFPLAMLPTISFLKPPKPQTAPMSLLFGEITTRRRRVLG